MKQKRNPARSEDTKGCALDFIPPKVCKKSETPEQKADKWVACEENPPGFEVNTFPIKDSVAFDKGDIDEEGGLFNIEEEDSLDDELNNFNAVLIQNEEIDDSDGDPDFKEGNEPETDTDRDSEQVQSVKRKKRWTDEEKKLFKCLFGKYIHDKILPCGKVIQMATKQLQGRSVFQIRTRIHNMISGKQVFE